MNAPVTRHALLVTAADLAGTLSGPGPLTVFAPTNDAFALLLTELGVTKAQLLADKPLARRLGEAGLALVSERYDFEGYLSGLEDLFRRLAAAKPRPGGAPA